MVVLVLVVTLMRSQSFPFILAFVPCIQHPWPPDHPHPRYSHTEPLPPSSTLPPPFPPPRPQTFRTARLKLERVEREPGLNTTGMVAWMMNLKTPECPQGRQVRVGGGRGREPFIWFPRPPTPQRSSPATRCQLRA